LFTGIVTHIGRILSVEGTDGRTLTVAPGFDPGEVPIGASIAHSGVCLTVTGRETDRYRVFLSPETLARTTASGWRAGDLLNLERSLRLGDELGGHLVFGHVDAVGRLESVEPAGDSRILRFSLPPDLAPLVAVKGSIAVDGVSLTVNAVERGNFAVTVVPHTLEVTTLGRLAPGDPVNLEADMLARYVARQLAFRDGPRDHAA